MCMNHSCNDYLMMLRRLRHYIKNNYNKKKPVGMFIPIHHDLTNHMMRSHGQMSKSTVKYQNTLIPSINESPVFALHTV